MKNEQKHKTTSGRSSIYDFDEWTNAHYGNSFKRQQRIRTNDFERTAKRESDRQSSQKEFMLAMVFIMFLIFTVMREDSHDVDRLKDKKNDS